MTWCGPPSIENLLSEWWGGGRQFSSLGLELSSLASNLRFGGNPEYQISDFLAFYPKFATYAQAIQAAIPNGITPGGNYLVDDLVTLTQPDASGAVLKVIAVDNATGAPTSYQVQTPGTGYSVAQGVATTTNSAAGTGALVDITAIVPYASAVNLPQLVLQTFINLAFASLQKARWADSWTYAMHLYVAHFATLYLDSEGNPGSGAGQAAISGLGKGIAVSKAAGDVSVGYETQVDDAWTSFNLTKYGQQLVTMAKIVGMGGMYIR